VGCDAEPRRIAKRHELEGGEIKRRKGTFAAFWLQGGINLSFMCGGVKQRSTYCVNMQTKGYKRTDRYSLISKAAISPKSKSAPKYSGSWEITVFNYGN
jgi:hypothetical protein